MGPRAGQQRPVSCFLSSHRDFSLKSACGQELLLLSYGPLLGFSILPRKASIPARSESLVVMAGGQSHVAGQGHTSSHAKWPLNTVALPDVSRGPSVTRGGWRPVSNCPACPVCTCTSSWRVPAITAGHRDGCARRRVCTRFRAPWGPPACEQFSRIPFRGQGASFQGVGSCTQLLNDKAGAPSS